MILDTTKTIVLTNHKGGAGKTSCCIGLAYSLSKLGYSVLVVDTDPQGNSTDNILTIELDDEGRAVDGTGIFALMEHKKTLYDAMYERRAGSSIEEYISPSSYGNLYLLASDGRLVSKTQELQSRMGMCDYPYRALFEEIKTLNRFDFVIVDTCPSIGGENRQVFIAADHVIVPTTTGVRSTDGVIRVIEAIESCNDSIKNCAINILGIVINQVDARTAVAKSVIPDLQETYGDLLFETIIPIDEAVKQAEQLTEPVGSYTPKARASVAFDDLAQEVLKRV